jgi:hypothetical protein
VGKYNTLPARISLSRSAKTQAARQPSGAPLEKAFFKPRKDANHAYPSFQRSVSHWRKSMPPSLTRQMMMEISRKRQRMPDETKFLIANTFGKKRGVKPNAYSLKSLNQSRNHILADSAIASLYEAATHRDMFESVKQNFCPIRRWLLTLSSRRGEKDEDGKKLPPGAKPHLDEFKLAADDGARKAALKKAANAASMGLGNLRIADANRNTLILHGFDPELTENGLETAKTKANRKALYGLLAYASNSDGSAPSDAQKDFANLIFSIGGATMSKASGSRVSLSSSRSNSSKSVVNDMI